MKLFVSKEETPLGTVGPIKLIQRQLGSEPFILMNGDVISLLDYDKFYRFSCENDALLNVTIKKIITPYEFGNIFFSGDRVQSIEEKKDIVTYALAGIYVVKSGVKKIRKL